MTGTIVNRSHAPALTVAAEALIDLAAIAHNTETLAGYARGELLAVVNADGFGHGAIPVARTALAHGAPPGSVWRRSPRPSGCAPPASPRRS